MTQTRMIEIARIDAGDRLRALDPAWVDLLAEEIALDGMQEPIRVVERGENFRLVAGARRVAACLKLGLTGVEALIQPAEDIPDDTAVRLAEIKSNMLRGDLTVLDRALYLAAWREIHEAVQITPKRGRKSLKASDEELQEMSAQCANIFSEAAKVALGVSRRSIYLLLKIASIDSAAAAQIALHPIADKRGELLLLADQTSVRQAAIVAKLVADPAEATSVTEAIALLDNTVAETRAVPAYERMHERFSTLKPAERERFFDLNSDAIEAWLAKRASAGRKAAA